MHDESGGEGVAVSLQRKEGFLRTVTLSSLTVVSSQPSATGGRPVFVG